MFDFLDNGFARFLTRIACSALAIVAAFTFLALLPQEAASMLIVAVLLDFIVFIVFNAVKDMKTKKDDFCNWFFAIIIAIELVLGLVAPGAFSSEYPTASIVALMASINFFAYFFCNGKFFGTKLYAFLPVISYLLAFAISFTGFGVYIAIALFVIGALVFYFADDKRPFKWKSTSTSTYTPPKTTSTPAPKKSTPEINRKVLSEYTEDYLKREVVNTYSKTYTGYQFKATFTASHVIENGVVKIQLNGQYDLVKPASSYTSAEIAHMQKYFDDNKGSFQVIIQHIANYIYKSVKYIIDTWGPIAGGPAAASGWDCEVKLNRKLSTEMAGLGVKITKNDAK